MCFFGGGSGLDKVTKGLDPGGYIVEKTAPKAFAPFSGLHGTMTALLPEPPPPPRPRSASQKLLGE